MINDTIKRLEAARAKVSALEANLATERSKELSSLPARFGFGSATEFANAVLAASEGVVAPKVATVAKVAKVAKAASGKRHRAVITAETKAQVKTLVEGGKTGAEIAKALHISLPSVQNIKKELGLVKARKKK